MLTRILLLWGALLVVFAPAVAHADVVDDASFAETSWHALDDRQITGMAWAPDGSNRLFITNKEGRVRIVKYGPPVVEVETPFATITPISIPSECGLIGLAFDPDFQANHYVYFFVTVSNSEQQIIRYTAQGDVGTNKTVIVEDLPTAGANHDGGAVAIGPDNKLYWAIGDNGNGTGVDGDLTSLATKVGRANRDGTVPNDNPFFDGDGPNADYIWARGLRNPFTMTFQPETGALWVNVVGDSYEQVFVVSRGDHAGYNDYENNQPAGYITPIIKYRTNDSETRNLTASGAVRSGGVTTFTSNAAHRFRRGERIAIAGVSNTSFNGNVFVASTPTATTFTAQQAGADATSGNGSATTQNLGGSITGGTFYTGTQFPEAYRGDYFFGDYNSDNVVRAALSAPSTVERVELWSTTIHGYIDIETGPDGALYYIEHGGEIHRVAYKASAQALVVSNTNVWMTEGGQQSIGVSLAIAPGANVTVNVARASGDSGISVSAGSTLTFTPGNWNVPRAVTISSAVDADMASDVATLEVSASGLTSQSVTVNAVEGDGGNALVVSTAALELDEGADGTFTVALASAPAADVTVDVTRSSGDGDITVTGGASLTFSAANFDVAQTVTIAAAEDADNGNDSATIAVAASGLSTRSIAVTATDNDPAAPVITSSAATTAILNVQYRYTVTATGRPAPTFSLSASPAGMAIGGSSGAISWTPSSSGTFPVTVVAANGVTPNATQSFDVTVTADAPPTCSLTEPVVNQVVSGTTAEFFGDGHDDIGTVRAEFFVDGTVGYSDVGTAGHYHWRSGHALWDTTAYNDGSHQVKMKITDTVGQSCEVEIGIVIDNGMEPVADAGTSPDAGVTGPGQDGGPPVTPPRSDGGVQPPTGPGSSGSGGRSGTGGSASSAGRGGNASPNPGAGSAAPGGNAAPEGDPDLTGGCSLVAGHSTSHTPLASLGVLALALALAIRRRRTR